MWGGGVWSQSIIREASCSIYNFPSAWLLYHNRIRGGKCKGIKKIIIENLQKKIKIKIGHLNCTTIDIYKVVASVKKK